MRYGWLAKFTSKKTRLRLMAKYGIREKPIQNDLCSESCTCCVTPESGCCGDTPVQARAYCTHFWCSCCANMQEYKTITQAIKEGKGKAPFVPLVPESPTDPHYYQQQMAR